MRAKTKMATGKRKLQHESLEDRICLTASAGWDGPGLGSATLTYTVGQAPADVGQATFESAVESALKVWSDVADIEFVETNRTGLADSIDFTFGSIDGKGNVLAQAYLPDDVNRGRLAGDVQFDSNETWEIGNARGSRATDLVWVAVHEVGHALGLEHEHDHDHDHDHGAVMAASVSPQTSFQTLATADVDAILGLYAPATTTPTVSTTPTPPSSSDASGSIDNTLNPESTDEANDPTNESPTDSDTDDGSDAEDEGDSQRDRWRNWRQRVNRWTNRFARRWRNFGHRFDRGGNDSSSDDQSQNESLDLEQVNTQVETFRSNRGRLVRVVRFRR